VRTGSKCVCCSAQHAVKRAGADPGYISFVDFAACAISRSAGRARRGCVEEACRRDAGRNDDQAESRREAGGQGPLVTPAQRFVASRAPLRRNALGWARRG